MLCWQCSDSSALSGDALAAVNVRCWYGIPSLRGGAS